jgi:hypothetical protein
MEAEEARIERLLVDVIDPVIDAGIVLPKDQLAMITKPS